MADKVALRQVFLQVLLFPLAVPFNQYTYTLFHLVGTVCNAAVSSFQRFQIIHLTKGDVVVIG